MANIYVTFDLNGADSKGIDYTRVVTTGRPYRHVANLFKELTPGNFVTVSSMSSYSSLWGMNNTAYTVSANVYNEEPIGRDGSWYIVYFEKATGHNLRPGTSYSYVHDIIRLDEPIKNCNWTVGNTASSSAPKPQMMETKDTLIDRRAVISEPTILIGYVKSADPLPSSPSAISRSRLRIYPPDDDVTDPGCAKFTARISMFAGNWVTKENYTTLTPDHHYMHVDLPVPEREGYIFKGWKDQSGRIVTSDDVVTSEDDITLTAVWMNKNVFFDDTRYLLRNNVTDVAQILKSELTGKDFETNCKYTLTSDPYFKEGVTYFTRQLVQSAKYPATSEDAVYHYTIADVKVGDMVNPDTYYVYSSDFNRREGYADRTLARGVDGEATDTAFDSRWDDGVGMYRMIRDEKYPYIDAYASFAFPYLLKAVASYINKYNWRLHVLIDASLSYLIDKFKITVSSGSSVVEDNGKLYKYVQTEDEKFVAGKDYYKIADHDYYKALVEVGTHVRTQTDYRETTDTAFKADVVYYKREEDPSSFARYKYVRMIPGTDYVVGEEISDDDRPNIFSPTYNGYNDYFERVEISRPEYYLLKDGEPTDPETNRYYEPIPPNEVVSAGKKYFYYDASSNDYRECSLYDGDTYQYYTREYDEVTESYGYVPIDFTNPENCKADAFANKSIYRLELDGYICVGNPHQSSTLFIDHSKNSSYSTTVTGDWKKSKLYKQIVVGSSVMRTIDGTVHELVVDPKNEDVERIKDVVNVFVTKYKTVLLVTGRNRVKMSAIRGDSQYTVADLVERLNIITDSMSSYTTPIERVGYKDATNEPFSPTTVKYYIRLGFNSYNYIESPETIATVVEDGVTRVAPADQQTVLGNNVVYMESYTARDLKLKANEIIDFIRNESFYLTLFEGGYAYNLNGFSWDDMIHGSGGWTEGDLFTEMVFNTDATRESDIYNDRWYFYDPTIKFTNALFPLLDFKKEKTVDEVGYIRKYTVSHPSYTYALAKDTTYNKTVVYCYKDPSDSTIKQIEDDSDIVKKGSKIVCHRTGGNVYIRTRPTSKAVHPGYDVYTGAIHGWIPLCQVTDVCRIADAWSRSNYAGCMQILYLTRRMLYATTPDLKLWREAFNDLASRGVSPEICANVESFFNKLDEFDSYIERIIDMGPSMADVIVDITKHVTQMFKMNMKPSIPVMTSVSKYTRDTVYFRYIESTDVYEKVNVSTSLEFKEKLALYGKLYAWVFESSK